MHLKSRTTRDWYREIRKIKNKVVRIQVACIVWYDYIAERKTSMRPWPSYIKAWRLDDNADPIHVANALMLVGYSESQAKKRSTIPQGNNSRARHTH